MRMHTVEVGGQLVIGGHACITVLDVQGDEVVLGIDVSETESDGADYAPTRCADPRVIRYRAATDGQPIRGLPHTSAL
jgi:hypothetical protein